MIRSWGLVALTGAAQPVFGDVTTAAVGLATQNGDIPVTVASTTRYKAGDRIYLAPGTGSQDLLLVDNIPSGTVLNCKAEGNVPTHVHASGIIVQLSLACMDVIVQLLGSHLLVLGTDSTVTVVPGGSAFYVLEPATAPAQPNAFRLGTSTDNNTLRTEDEWMIGTAADTVLVSAIVL